MLHGWDFINRRLQQHEMLICHGATKQEQALPILELEESAKDIGIWLLERLYRCSRAAPECRKLLLRQCSTAVTDYKYEYHKNITPAEAEVFDLFENSHWKEEDDALLHWPVLLAFYLEKAESLLETSVTARRMITGHMVSLLSDLSIITELLRQLSLWAQSPEVKTGKVDGCGCKIRSHTSSHIDFDQWNNALNQDFHPPLEFVFPLREQLHYPEHKKRGPDIVAAMRKAEANLDRFWAAIDSHYENKTGLAQHRIIQDCLEEHGRMHRTAPWDGAIANKTKLTKPLDHEYQPILDQLHDKDVQITGAFNRMAVVDKIKPKTRGTAGTDIKATCDLSVKPPEQFFKATTRVFKVDKRTYSLFHTLLSATIDGPGETPKSAKWVDFKRAMVRMGFSAEKLQGSAWQFVPTADVGNERGIQFHEPHPDSEITYVIAKRMGRRLGRVYGWRGDMFQLA